MSTNTLAQSVGVAVSTGVVAGSGVLVAVLVGSMGLPVGAVVAVLVAVGVVVTQPVRLADSTVPVPNGLPSRPPTITRRLPTATPAVKPRLSFKLGPSLQVSVAG